MYKRIIRNLQMVCGKTGSINILDRVCNSRYKTYQEIRSLQYIKQFMPIDNSRKNYSIIPRHAKTCDILNWLSRLLKEGEF